MWLRVQWKHLRLKVKRIKKAKVYIYYNNIESDDRDLIFFPIYKVYGCTLEDI